MLTQSVKAIQALVFGVDTCNAAIKAISNHCISTTQHTAVPDVAVLHKDFISLLSLLHGSSTKLSLSLKPSSPTYKASLTPLKDIAVHVNAIAHCVGLLDDAHGLTLIKEFVSVAEGVIGSIKALLQTFLDVEATGSRGSTGKAGDEYMVRTGKVHELIEKVRGASGLSSSNIIAVRKRWARDHGPLHDGVKELSETIEESQSEDGGEDEDDDMDDGWGELGINSGKKMEQDELERAKKVCLN